MDTASLVAIVREALPDVIAIYLFGSHAKGSAGAGSDIDLAVLCDQPLDAVARFDLAQRLAVAAHGDVDLVDLRVASTVMRVQVLEHARLLHESDRAARAHFEATALSSYARLNEERRGILDDIRRRGHVHR